MVKIKRVYEEPTSQDGYRVLVDRLWPRGVSKQKAAVDLWLKEVAPSNELRKWFNHEPAKFEQFKKRYAVELKNNAALKQLKEIIKDKRDVTLLYGARDPYMNQAVVLKEYLFE